jgi:eukaryotic-like serine/threonine-protein kinase
VNLEVVGACFDVPKKVGVGMALIWYSGRATDHKNTLQTMNNLGVAYVKAKKLDLGLPLLEETLRLRQATLGPDHPATLTNMTSLATTFDLAGLSDRGLRLHEETLRLMTAKFGADHPETLT